MTERTKDLEAEVARLRGLVESLPQYQTKLAEQRAFARRARFHAIGRMDPGEALAELAKVDVGPCLDVIGATATARILAEADKRTQDRYLKLACRAVRDEARAILTPDAEVPRTVVITPMSSSGGFETALPVPFALATRLVEARIGVFDPNNRKRYLAPTLAIGLKVRWPCDCFETLLAHWPLLAEGVESGSVVVRPCTLAEDRAVLASGR